MWVCPICQFNAGTDEQLQSHILQVHKKEVSESVQYHCTGCGKIYSKYESLRKHQQTCGGAVRRTSQEQGPSTSREQEAQVVDHDADPSTRECRDKEGDHESESLSEEEEEPENYEEAVLSVEEALQIEVADFLGHIKEECNATQRIVDEVTIGVRKIQKRLMDFVGKLIQDKAGNSDVILLSDALTVLEDVKEMDIFDGFDSSDEMLAYLQRTEGLVLPEKVVLKQEAEIRNGKLVMKDVDFFYQVPFLPQLEKLLNCKDVWFCVENPKPSEPYKYRCMLDGIVYQRHQVVKNSEGRPVVAIVLYHDGVEPGDTASARAGKNNLTLFYWLLGNLYPELKCSHHCIQLYAVIKSTTLKEYGYEAIMKNMIDGINSLSSSEGVTFDIRGERRIVQGILECSCGDNPAQAAIGGFKESVTAEKPCRHCYASTDEDYLQETNFQAFQLRTLALHKQQVKQVELYEAFTPSEKVEYGFKPSVRYGINRRSELLKVNHLDISIALPQDQMHSLNEGCSELTCRLLLRHVIQDEKNMTISEVNQQIAECSKYFDRDKPGEIQVKHLPPNKTLRQSAAQIRVLCLVLPFALQQKQENGSWAFAGNREYLDCFLVLSQIMNFCLAYEFLAEDSPRLAEKIQDYHKKLLMLVPDLNMAKVHFLHHLPELIILYGGIRHVHCFSFEGLHSRFKRLLKLMHNFKNPMKSVATRHQAKQCRQMMKENFLYGGHEFTVDKDVSGTIGANITEVKLLFPNASKICELTMLKIHGTSYKKGSVVILSESKTLPDFGRVKTIYSIDDKDFVFVCQKMRTVCLALEVNAFEIEIAHGQGKSTVDALKLIYPHQVVWLRWKGKEYALPLGHRLLLA